MERKAREEEERLNSTVNGLEKEKSDLSERYIAALNQFDSQLQEIEEDIREKRREIADTRQIISEKCSNV